jgi:hypothetical protein
MASWQRAEITVARRVDRLVVCPVAARKEAAIGSMPDRAVLGVRAMNAEFLRYRSHPGPARLSSHDA